MRYVAVVLAIVLAGCAAPVNTAPDELTQPATDDFPDADGDGVRDGAYGYSGCYAKWDYRGPISAEPLGFWQAWAQATSVHPYAALHWAQAEISNGTAMHWTFGISHNATSYEVAVAAKGYQYVMHPSGPFICPGGRVLDHWETPMGSNLQPTVAQPPPGDGQYFLDAFGWTAEQDLPLGLSLQEAWDQFEAQGYNSCVERVTGYRGGGWLVVDREAQGITKPDPVAFDGRMQEFEFWLADGTLVHIPQGLEDRASRSLGDCLQRPTSDSTDFQPEPPAETRESSIVYDGRFQFRGSYTDVGWGQCFQDDGGACD